MINDENKYIPQYLHERHKLSKEPKWELDQIHREGKKLIEKLSSINFLDQKLTDFTDLIKQAAPDDISFIDYLSWRAKKELESKEEDDYLYEEDKNEIEIKIKNSVFERRLAAFKKELQKKDTLEDILKESKIWLESAGFIAQKNKTEKKAENKIEADQLIFQFEQLSREPEEDENAFERRYKMIRLIFDRILEIQENNPHYSDLDHIPHESAHSFKKWNFILCAALSVVALFCPVFAALPAALLFLGPAWNFVDASGDAVTSVADWREAEERLRHEKTRKTLAATGFAGVLAMGGTAIWALVEIAKALKESSSIADLTGSGVVGMGAATVALASSSFGFAFAFFASAVAASLEAKWAWERSTPQGFIADRDKKIEILNEKIDNLASSDDHENQFMKDLVLQKHRLVNQKELMERYEKKDKTLTPAEKKIATYLLEKQKMKAREKGMEAAAYYLGGCGAVCAGLALLLPPAAPVLFVLSVMFFTASAVIKSGQLYEKREKKKARDEVLGRISDERRQEKKKELICQFFGVKNDQDEQSDQDQKELKKNLKYLSSKDREKIVDLQCQKEYEQIQRARSQGYGFFSKRPSCRDHDNDKSMNIEMLPMSIEV